MSSRVRTHEAYWTDYDGLQHAKHQLLTKYLEAWFPILSTWSGRVLYLDCHAGRGRHQTGQEGSPVLALRTLLGHSHCSRILSSTQVCFVFFERDRTNYDYLCKEIQALGALPHNVEVEAVHADYDSTIRRIIERLRTHGQQLAPAFAFLDPYGFSLPMDLCNELLQFPKCELLINFMYRYVDMAMRNPSPSDKLPSLFGCMDWVQLATVQDHEERTKQTIALFSEQLDAEFVTHMYMRASNRVLKYVLLHATNDRKGRQVMKRAMWSVKPDGSFTAFEHQSPNQLVLIEPEPSLKPLEDLLWAQFAGQRVHMEELYEWLVGELYLEKHLHEVLRRYRQRQLIDCSNYEGRFAFSKNPTIQFSRERPARNAAERFF